MVAQAVNHQLQCYCWTRTRNCSSNLRFSSWCKRHVTYVHTTGRRPTATQQQTTHKTSSNSKPQPSSRFNVIRCSILVNIHCARMIGVQLLVQLVSRFHHRPLRYVDATSTTSAKAATATATATSTSTSTDRSSSLSKTVVVLPPEGKTQCVNQGSR